VHQAKLVAKLFGFFHVLCGQHHSLIALQSSDEFADMLAAFWVQWAAWFIQHYYCGVSHQSYCYWHFAFHPSAELPDLFVPRTFLQSNIAQILFNWLLLFLTHSTSKFNLDCVRKQTFSWMDWAPKTKLNLLVECVRNKRSQLKSICAMFDWRKVRGTNKSGSSAEGWNAKCQ
jgi:hypothetical protein